MGSCWLPESDATATRTEAERNRAFRHCRRASAGKGRTILRKSDDPQSALILADLLEEQGRLDEAAHARRLANWWAALAGEIGAVDPHDSRLDHQPPRNRTFDVNIPGELRWMLRVTHCAKLVIVTLKDLRCPAYPYGRNDLTRRCLQKPGYLRGRVAGMFRNAARREKAHRE
jgi:hypothetical protein